MQYGEKYTATFIDRISGKRFPLQVTYKRATWHNWHTDDEGNGLWCDEKQILGTCDFSVAGCKTEKAAVNKVRNYVNSLQ